VSSSLHDAPVLAMPARDARGRFAHPWSIPGGVARGFRDMMRWQLQRLRTGESPWRSAATRMAVPTPALPRTAAGELRITWVGHATFLLQIDGVNILTDPVWSLRASPLAWAGPARVVPAAVDFDSLPPIDLVVLSHDHYDHLDSATVRRLHARHGDALQWVTPLGYARWLRRRGVRSTIELNWWQSARLQTAGGMVELTAAPVQHWTKRSPFDERRRLWASYRIAGSDRSVYFCGDSGWYDGFADTGAALGPFDASLLPIGAYEPRWFMRGAHMNPEEAVAAYRALGDTGLFVAMHWGTFLLTDEPPTEPPARARAAWAAAGLPPDDLWIAQHGETRVVQSR
jgi:N-acyl-phosphatidylethanolamine-hydrolysing phospholipase D